MGMVNDYFISEGNKIGALPTEFGDNVQIKEKKLIADGDIKKGQVVEVSGDLKVKVTTAASSNVLGVAMFDAKNGEPVVVESEGLFKMVAASAITAPTHIESAADGKVAASTTADNFIGKAISNAGTDEYVFVKFSI